MSDLETLKAQHPDRCWECGQYDKALCEEYGHAGDEKFFATLLTLVQQHEAELAKAQETIQQQARELEEADESLYELFQSRDKEYALSGDTENCCRAAFMRLKSRHSARAQQEQRRKERG